MKKGDKKDKELLQIEKKVSQKNKIKQAFEDMDQFILQCDQKIEKNILKARQAKDEQSKKLFKATIAQAMAVKNRAQKMRFSAEAIMDLNEITSMTATFLQNMTNLCNQLNETSKSISFGKLNKPFMQAMQNYEMQSNKLEDIFDNLSLNFDEIDVSLDIESEQEIDKLINQDSDDSILKQIESRIDKLRR